MLLTAAIIWQRNDLGSAVSSGLPCGNITPVGITGTPVVDLASRSLFFDAEVSGTGHQIFSLNVDTGATNAGWPVTVSAAVSGFDSDRSQSERGALGFANGVVYVPYGGRFGDCGSYHGRLVGVQISNPANVMSYATAVRSRRRLGAGRRRKRRHKFIHHYWERKHGSDMERSRSSDSTTTGSCLQRFDYGLLGAD